jgi:hypothetical protein
MFEVATGQSHMMVILEPYGKLCQLAFVADAGVIVTDVNGLVV